MRHPGFERRKNLKDEMQGFAALIKIHKGEEVPAIKRRKPRALETEKRDMGEKRLEELIILRLKLAGCEVAKAGEQSTYNSRHVLNGMSDLLVFVPDGGVIFMEVKLEKYRNTKDGGLRDSQVKFRDLCHRCGLRYEVVYNVKETIKKVLTNGN